MRFVYVQSPVLHVKCRYAQYPPQNKKQNKKKDQPAGPPRYYVMKAPLGADRRQRPEYAGPNPPVPGVVLVEGCVAPPENYETAPDGTGQRVREAEGAVA